MKNKQIQEFLTKVSQDEGFKAEVFKLNQKVESKKLSEEAGKQFISEVVLPKAKELGYSFKLEDLAEFFASQEGASLASLSPEDLENVSGGVFPFAAVAVSALIGMFGVGAGRAAVANHFSDTAVEARQVEAATKEVNAENKAVADIIDEMLQTLNSDKVCWNIDNMDQATKVKFLAQLNMVTEKVQEDKTGNFYVPREPNVADGFGYYTGVREDEEYESKVLKSLVALKHAWDDRSRGDGAMLTNAELRFIFGGDYNRLAADFTIDDNEFSNVTVSGTVNSMFSKLNGEWVRWDVRNIDEDQREELKQTLATMMKLVERDADGVYSIPWGNGYGGTEHKDESQKLRALFELKTAIDNQERGVEPKLEKETLKNIFGEEYTEIIEAVPTWKTYVEKVVENLNDPNVDWNLERLSEDARDEVLNQLGTICSNIEQGPEGLYIPACGIDAGYGDTKKERNMLGQLLALNYQQTQSKTAGEKMSDGEAAYYNVEDDGTISQLAKSAILMYMSSDAYSEFPVRDSKAVNKFIQGICKRDSELKRNKEAQEEIRTYLMSDEACKLTDKDKKQMDARKRQQRPTISWEDQKRLLGTEEAQNLREDQQDRREEGLAELAGELDEYADELNERKKAQDADAEILRQREAGVKQSEKNWREQTERLRDYYAEKIEELKGEQAKIDGDRAKLVEDTETLRENEQLLSTQKENFEREKRDHEAEHKNRMQEVEEAYENQLDAVDAMQAALIETYMRKAQDLSDEFAGNEEARKQEHAKELFAMTKRANEQTTRNREERQVIQTEWSRIEQRSKELDDIEKAQAETEAAQQAEAASLAQQKEEQKAEAKRLDGIRKEQQENQENLERLRAVLRKQMADNQKLRDEAVEATDQLATMEDKIAGITRQLRELQKEKAKQDKLVIMLAQRANVNLNEVDNLDSGDGLDDDGLDDDVLKDLM